MLVTGLTLTLGTNALRAQGTGLRVVVDGNTASLSPGPIERAGRVFVPLRGIFERLGASVVYHNGTINATKGDTNVSLRIGSTQAKVGGQERYLDAAAFIVGATTYVPLRFVAQSLGAVVGYDGQNRVVTIASSAAPAPAPPAVAMRLRSQQPAPDTTSANRFATISAEFSRRVNPDSLRIWLDGADVTSRCGRSATTFSYAPPAPYDLGSHTMRVAGDDLAGSHFDRSWSFTVGRSAPTTIFLTIRQPSANGPVGPSFLVVGSTVANANVEVTAGASAAGTGQFAGTTTAGPLGNFTLNVNLSTLMGQQAVTVKITASDPASSQTLTKTLYLRLGQ
ncbi:MAG: copper amine oxidase N-terminal domain-containing protein [Candidatus Baltobacteraceae bacterium]